MSNAIKVLFLTKYGRLGASSRIRTLQFFDYFTKYEIKCSVNYLIDDDCLRNKYLFGRYECRSIILSYIRRIFVLLNKYRYDVVWIEKEALPWLPFCLEKMLLKGVPYVLDYDDAIFHNYDQHRMKLIRYFYAHRVDLLMAGASLVTVGNNYLAERAHAAGACRVEKVPTVVDLSKYTASANLLATSDVPIIVWIGSPSTSRYLEILRRPLRELSQLFAFKLRIIGADNVYFEGVDVENIAWTEEAEVQLIRECSIGVMPLYNTSWELGKCGYKLIQYMACGLSVVASRVGANMEIVSHGENGFLVDSEREWVDALALLLSDLELRSQFGQKGRTVVESRYSLQSQVPRLVKMLQKLATHCTH